MFCALDRNIYEPINGSRSKIRFTLKRTLADDVRGSTIGTPGEGSPDPSRPDSNVEHREEQVRKEGEACEFKFVKVK